MRVHLGCDHAGLELKSHLTDWLRDHVRKVDGEMARKAAARKGADVTRIDRGDKAA